MAASAGKAQSAAAAVRQSAHGAAVYIVRAHGSAADAHATPGRAYTAANEARTAALQAGKDADAAAAAAAQARQAEIDKRRQGDIDKRHNRPVITEQDIEQVSYQTQKCTFIHADGTKEKVSCQQEYSENTDDGACSTGIQSLAIGVIGFGASTVGVITTPLTGGAGTVVGVIGYQASAVGLVYGLETVFSAC